MFHWLTHSPAGSVVFLLIAVIALFIAYMLPSILGLALDTPHLLRLALVNLLLAWTVVGWIACLVWALLYSRNQDSFDRKNRKEPRLSTPDPDGDSWQRHR